MYMHIQIYIYSIGLGFDTCTLYVRYSMLYLTNFFQLVSKLHFKSYHLQLTFTALSAIF